MSDAMTRAWAASATALQQNVLAYGADLLGLDPANEKLSAAMADQYGVEMVLEAPHGAGLIVPLVTTSMKEWRRRGPGSPTEMFVRALGRIAMVRIWRRHGTVAPPFGLLEVNGLGKALIERASLDPQAFFDATWASEIHIGNKYSDTLDWMSDKAIPTLLARAPIASRKRLVSLPRLPWVSGYSSLDAVFIEAASLDERLALLWRPQDSTGFEVRLPAGLPATLVTAAPTRPLRNFVSHPLLNRFELEIDQVRLHQKSMRMKVRGGAVLWRRYRLKGGNEERRELRDELRAMRDGRRQVEKLIAGHLTLPGRRGDVEVPWDPELFDEDEIDDLTGQPWPDMPAEGISSRRFHEERLHDDGDPLIRFDEDDPASYL